MSTIQTKRIEGYGPYVYRVEYIDQDDGHEWEYIGPIGQIDPGEITDDELEELGQHAISRFRDGVEADLQRRDVANEVRDQLVDEIGEHALSPTDDRRDTLVELADDAPRDAEIIVQNTAEDMAAATRTVGQAELTDAERDRLDFSERTIFHARASKAVLLDEGIDDWTAVYDPTVPDPAAQRDLAKKNREDIIGDRTDNDERPSRSTTSQRETESQQEEQALKYAKEGDEQARDYLKERGWTDDEIETTEPQL